MQKSSQYTAGWIDTTIHDFLSEIEEPSSTMSYALVTCLDSTFDVASLVRQNPQLRELKTQGKIVGKGILLTTRRLLALERRQRLFFGFDEVWFFSHAKQVKMNPKPKKLVITGPDKIAPMLLEELTVWMESNGCYLGLGDGTGMNFAAKLRGVAKYLVEFISEPESNDSQDGQAIVSQEATS